MKPKVFVTGSSGFIGSYVLQEFVDHGWEVHALIHQSVTPHLQALQDAGKVVLHQGDSTDFDSLDVIFANCGEQAFDAIVHCAGRASDVGPREAFRQANYESVQHLAKLTLSTESKRFVFISSTDVYGMHDFNGETEQELPMESQPANPYPEFKIKAEQWLAENMPSERYAIIRPAAVWGKGDLTITKRVVDFLKVSPWIVHFGKWKGGNRWPLAHVRNVAAATYLLASVDGWSGKAVNVLDSERVSVDTFYRMIADAFFPSKRFRSVTLPVGLMAPVAHLITAISNVLGLAQPFTDPSHYALLSVSSNLDFSNQRFLDLMKSGGRKPVTLDEGVSELTQE